jgi:hypothetical protein
MRNCASGNLEIPGLVLTHHPGMTASNNWRDISVSRFAFGSWDSSDRMPHIAPQQINRNRPC